MLSNDKVGKTLILYVRLHRFNDNLTSFLSIEGSLNDAVGALTNFTFYFKSCAWVLREIISFTDNLLIFVNKNG